MNKLMGVILTIAIAAVAAALCLNWNDEKPLYLSETYAPMQTPVQPAVANVSLAAVNRRAESLRDFKCSVNAKIYRRLTVNLTGGILFEKPKQSSIYFDSRLGREVHVGSNADEFWFYSKRMDNPALYYARHEDLYRTRLKAPFHPLWLMQGLGIEPLSFTANPRFEKDGGNLRIVADEKGPNGRFVRRVVLIDSNETVRGNYLYDESNKLMASIEINSTTTAASLIVPQNLRLVWIEGGEKTVVDMELKDITVNTGRKSVIRRPTEYGQQIDMTKD